MNRNKLTQFLLLMFCFFGTYTITFTATVEFPLIQSVCYFPYSDNSMLNRGRITGTVDIYYSNTYMFNDDRSILNDFETFSATLGFRYGLRPRMTLELFYRHTTMMGGFLDKFIEDFHSTFKLPDNRRSEYPRNSVHYTYKDYFSYTDNQNTSSPLIFALLTELLHSKHFSLKGRIALGIPLSHKPGFSSDKSFLTGGVILNYKKGILSLELANYVSFYKKPSWLGDEDIHTTLFHSGFEAKLCRAIMGLTFRTSVFKTDDIASNAYQGYIGYEITKFLDFIILEDFYPFDTTPDISFRLRVKFLKK